MPTKSRTEETEESEQPTEPVAAEPVAADPAVEAPAAADLANTTGEGRSVEDLVATGVPVAAAEILAADPTAVYDPVGDYPPKVD